MSAQNTDRDIVPALLEQALNGITVIKFLVAQPIKYTDPPLGAVGGAGTAVAATKIVLVLNGVSSRHAKIIRNAALNTAKPKIRLTVRDGQNDLYQLLAYNISPYNHRRLILIARGSVREPSQLTATVTGGTTIQWRILNTSS